MNRSWYRWMLLGGVLGAFTAGMMHNRNSDNKMRRIKRKAARMTCSMARNTGQIISSLGEDLARRIR
ncbi:MAG: hypothetical protein ACOX7H_05645 [Bacillota bacterium]|jgi:hypothetical protein